MELLSQHGLYGGGLTTIDSPALVSRYNCCLANIGTTPTALTQFQIDGRGWSPEIAREKDQPGYLSHGGATQYAIVLTPDQKDKPVYQPFFSFERTVLTELFKRHSEALAKITKQAGILVQMETGLSTIKGLADLHLIRSTSLKLSDTANLIKGAENQRTLVKRLVSESEAWANQELRQAIIASGKEFGDLRFPTALKSEFSLNVSDCYYLPSFGGVFVLRSRLDERKVLLVGNGQLAKQRETGVWTCLLRDKVLLTRLLDLGLLEIPLKWYRENLTELGQLRQSLLVATIYQAGRNPLDFNQLNEAQRQKCLMEYRAELPPEYDALERLEQRLTQLSPISLQRLPLSVKWLLARPAAALPPDSQEVLWKLICQVTSVLESTRFAYDKDGFYATYAEWPEPRQRWSVNCLLSTGFAPRRNS